MTIFIVRHGEGFHNTPKALEYLRSRGPDPVLTPRGVKQARYLGRYIRRHWHPTGSHWPGHRGLSIDRIYSSPMLRCLQTAIAMRGRLDMPIHVEPDLHECGGLDWRTESGEVFSTTGITTSQLATLAPNLVTHERITEKGWWFEGEERPEQWEPRGARVARWIEELVNEGIDSVILVTHAGIGGVVLRDLMGDLVYDSHWFRLNNASLTRLEIKPETGRRILHFHNSVNHLPHRLMTE